MTRTMDRRFGWHGLACAITLVGLAGCDRGGFVPPRETSLRATSTVPARARIDPRIVSRPVGDDWEAWLDRELARLDAERPALVADLRGLAPRITRAGLLRFTGPLVSQPDALPILLDRLRRRDDAPEVRAAVAEALPRTGADAGPALAGLFATEREPRVRETMAFALWRTQGEPGLAGLRLALADADARVRAEAVHAVAHREDGSRLGEAVLEATHDPDRGVRIAAAQALGVFRTGTGRTEALRRLALEGDPELTEHALAALGRIDPEQAEGLRIQIRSAVDDSRE